MNAIIFVRADASIKIGSGHIMRTLTLSQLLKKNEFKIVYLTKKLDGNLDGVINDNGFEVINIKAESKKEEFEEVSNLISIHGASMIVFDHYGIDYEYEEKIKKSSAAKVFSFDDMYEKHYCDILLNQNIYANKEKYLKLVPKNCVIMAGIQYALIREEFRKIEIREKNNINHKRVNILITLGGSDENNVIQKIISAIDRIDGFVINATVIAGKSNPT